jgi:hypothetical protein
MQAFRDTALTEADSKQQTTCIKKKKETKHKRIRQYRNFQAHINPSISVSRIASRHNYMEAAAWGSTNAPQHPAAANIVKGKETRPGLEAKSDTQM